MLCPGIDCSCRPLAFLLGLPFALLSLLVTIVGVFIWILGLPCRCCMCLTGLAEFGLALMKAPVRVMKWFAHKIPF